MVTKKEVITKLVAARNLVKKGWCKNHHAESKSGKVVDANSRCAVKFCASGALRRVTKTNYDLLIACLHVVEQKLPKPQGISDFNFITEYNDKVTTTKQDIIALFKNALTYLRTTKLMQFTSCGKKFYIE